MDLEAKEISLSLGKKPSKVLLDHVSFTMPKGAFGCVLGASGAGKSTMLKILAGILSQDSGSINFAGQSLDVLPAHKRNIGFVFQDMRLFPNMNVEENISFPCKMAKMPKKQRLNWANELLELVHLRGFAKRDVTTLSGGQKQRVSLARALAGKPQLLLLDEPFSGLDESLRDEMRSLVLKLHREFALTTVLVTHDAIEALEMSDVVVYLSKGQVIQHGSPQILYTQPQTAEIAACFGECSLLTGVVKDGEFRCSSMRLPATDCPDGMANAVIRYGGVRAILAASDTPVGGLPTDLFVRCQVYRGEDHLLRIDVDGQVLTAPVQASDTLLAPGAKVNVAVNAGSYFVYPQQNNTAVLA